MAYAGKEKKHILIIVENLPVPFDQRVWKEAKALASNNYSVSVICPKGIGFNNSYELREGINIYRHPIFQEKESIIGYLREYISAFLWEFFLSIKIYIKKPFDVIHACNPPDNIFFIGLFFKLFKVKYIFDHHDLAPEGYLAKFNRKDLFYTLLLYFEMTTFKLASISIATNNSYREIAIQRGKMISEKVFVVRNGPELDKFKGLLEKKSLKYGKKFLVGYVGIIGKQEGIDFLLKVISFIVKEKNRKDIHFTCIGGGPSLNYLKNLAIEINLSQYVNFTGIMPHKEVLCILRNSDVCVNPDTPNELNDKSTMVKIMEYMALRKPIVQFDFKEGKFSAQEASLYAAKGNIQDFGEKILTLLDNPDMRKRMGDYGYKRVRDKLDWKYSIPCLLDAYKSIF